MHFKHFFHQHAETMTRNLNVVYLILTKYLASVKKDTKTFFSTWFMDGPSKGTHISFPNWLKFDIDKRREPQNIKKVTLMDLKNANLCFEYLVFSMKFYSISPNFSARKCYNISRRSLFSCILICF